MGLVLDMSVLVAAERKDFDLARFLTSEAPDETILITTVTATELLHGVHRAEGETRLKREVFVEEMLRVLPVLPFDLPSARAHSRVWADLESQGSRIGAHDLLIASICLAGGHCLATLNLGDFRRVDGLRLAETGPYEGER